MRMTSLCTMSFLLLFSLFCGVFASAPIALAQAVVSVTPRQGEIRLSGTLTDVTWAKGRCVLLVTRILTADGADRAFSQPKPKTITLDAGTTFASIPSQGGIAIPIEGAEELRKGASVFVLGRNGKDGVVASRLICLIAPAEPGAPIEEETREPSEPPGKNLLLPTDNMENWGWMVMEPAKATIEREEGLLKVTVTEKGKEDWRIQLSQSAVFPEPGVSYTLSFRARAEPVRRLRVSAQVLESDFHDIGINRVASIGSEWKQYEYTFVARNLGAKGHIIPVFFFGTEKGTTWLADVTLSVSYPEQRGNMLEAISNPNAWKLVPLTKEGSASLNIMGDRLEIGTSAVGKQKQEIAYQLAPTSPTPLLPGRSYILTFYGRSGDERPIRIRGIAEPIKLGPEERLIETRFRVNQLAAFGLCPTILIGEQLGTFTLRNMVLREERKK